MRLNYYFPCARAVYLRYERISSVDTIAFDAIEPRTGIREYHRPSSSEVAGITRRRKLPGSITDDRAIYLLFPDRRIYIPTIMAANVTCAL